MRVVVSLSHIVTPSFSQGELLTHCPCSSMGFLPWETVLHELLQHGCLPRGAALQEPAASMWVLHWVTSPASKPAPLWTSLSMGPQVLPGACSSMGFPRGYSLLRTSTCSGMGSSTVDLHGLQGDSLPYHGLLHGLQENLCSGAWSTSSTSFFTDLGVCRVVSLIFSLLSLAVIAVMPISPPPFLNMLS